MRSGENFIPRKLSLPVPRFVSGEIYGKSPAFDLKPGTVNFINIWEDYMKRLKNKTPIFKMNDSVLTPISDRPGKIIRIEESVKAYFPYGEYVFKKYVVELSFPNLRDSGSTVVHLETEGQSLKKIKK